MAPAKIRMSEKTKEHWAKISEGLANLGFKEDKDFQIFNATGHFKVNMTPATVERLTNLVEAGISACISEFESSKNSAEKIRERFLKEND